MNVSLLLNVTIQLCYWGKKLESQSLSEAQAVLYILGSKISDADNLPVVESKGGSVMNV